MATIHRLDFPGALHHAYGRGNDKEAIFLDDSDRSFFMYRLKRLKEEMEFKLYAFCLMTNHYHLLIETANQALEKVMGRLLGLYAAHFNDRHGSVGHLFERPYCAKLCARDSYFLRLVRYIHRNPVQAGICAHPADWAWSGHNQLALGIPGLLDEELPLSYFGGNLSEARQAYREFVSDDRDDACADFMPEEPRIAPHGDLMDVAHQVAQDFSIPVDQLLSGRKIRSLTAAKVEFIRRADSEGHRQSEVARLLRCSSAALSQLRSRYNLNVKAARS